MANKTNKQLADAFAKAIAEEEKYKRLEKKHDANYDAYKAKISAIDSQIQKLNTQIEKLKIKRDELKAKQFKEHLMSSDYHSKVVEIMFGKRDKARKAIVASGNSREIWQELKKRGVLK